MAEDAFRTARRDIRNKVDHSFPFSAGTDADGNYLPGLAYASLKTGDEETIAITPEDLLDLAEAIEEAIDRVAEAREAVNALPIPHLN